MCGLGWDGPEVARLCFWSCMTHNAGRSRIMADDPNPLAMRPSDAVVFCTWPAAALFLSGHSIVLGMLGMLGNALPEFC